MKETLRPPVHLAWVVWGLGAAFYLIGFFHRVAPAVITSELMDAFGINATALGNLSAFYFYSYVAMQIPTGILADTWGPRRLLSVGALIAGTGTMLFALAPNIFWANLGRFLIGGSVGVAYVGILKLAGHWFPQRQFAMIAGVALFCGIIGAVFAGVPLRLFVTAVGWRHVMFASAVLTFLVCAAIWLIVRDDPQEKGYTSYSDFDASLRKPSRAKEIRGLLEVLRYANTWLLFFIPAGVVGCVLTFSGLWGVPYLTTHHGIAPTKAAALTSALLVAMALGGPVFGGLSDRIGRRKPLFITGCALALIGWAATLFISNLPIHMLVVLLLLTGFTSGSMIISFAFVKESVPAHLSGTVSGVINMGIMMGPTLLQPAVGWMLDRNWNGEIVNGLRVYGLKGYQAGFSLMIVWATVAFVLLFFTRETYCRQAV